MAVKQLPDIDLLRQLIAYDPATGSMVHRERPRSLFPNNRSWATWNARYAGKCAASPRGEYLRVILFNRQYKAHRVAFKIYYGIEPPAEIDHVNGNGQDNRIANLRAATSRENKLNQRLRKDSTTGIKGVSPIGSAFRATARVNGKQLHVGRFKTVEEAASARKAAEQVFYGKYARQSG